MRREDLHIPEPCHADWDKMTGDDKKRFCNACTKHVHNLSEMTHQEAATLLGSCSNLCVQYASHSSGEVFFRDSVNPAWRLHRQVEGTKKLLAAALSIPMLAGALVGCEAPESYSPDAVSPVIQINPDGTLKAPGSGIAPTFQAVPEVPEVPEVEVVQGAAEPEPNEIEELMGDVAMPEQEEHEEEVGITLGKVAIDHEPQMPEGETGDEPACEPGSKEDAIKANDAHDDNIQQVGTPTSKPVNIRRGRMKLPSSKKIAR